MTIKLFFFLFWETTKGSPYRNRWTDPRTSPYRQDRSPMLPRDPSLLQEPLPRGAQSRTRQYRREAPVAVGALRPSQGRRANQEPRRGEGADGQGAEPGPYGRGHPGRRADADRPGQSDCAGRGACTQKRGGQGHWTLEAPVRGMRQSLRSGARAQIVVESVRC